jgi:hypothetical protein
VSVAETLLVYVAIPLAIVLVLAALTLPGGHRRPRWKSGQPWEHEPVWFEPHPENASEGEHGAPAFGAAVTGGGTRAIGSSLYGEPADHGDAVEGRTSGASAASTPPVSAGPLGGARGTW